MHQKDDKLFTELLNNIRTGIADKCIEDVLKSQFMQKSDDWHPFRKM